MTTDPSKRYTPKERYLGYYWLILHTDPFHAPDGGDGGYGDGCIIPREYWRGEKPDWVKTNYPDDSINTWHAPKNIPLFQVDNTEIKSWKDIITLWRSVSIEDFISRTFYPAKPAIKVCEQKIKEAKKKGHVATIEEFKKEIQRLRKSKRPLEDVAWDYKNAEDLYKDNGDEILQALESYLEPQHKQNLKELETPGAGGEERATETPKTNTFCKKGNKWVITYMGEGPFYLNDYKGLHYIRHLLLNPNKTFEALELVRLVEGTPSGESIPRSQLGGELDMQDLSISYNPGIKQEILDSTAKENIERMKEKLKENLEEAKEASNIEEIEELEKKISELEKYLSSGVGLATKPRSFIGEEEKARKAVFAAIDRSRGEIKNHSQTLYKHLEKFITLGNSPSYNPTEPTPWE